jgi:hypothetical protein
VGLAPRTTVITKEQIPSKTYILRAPKAVEPQNFSRCDPAVNTLVNAICDPRPRPAGALTGHVLYIRLGVHNDTIAVPQTGLVTQPKVAKLRGLRRYLGFAFPNTSTTLKAVASRTEWQFTVSGRPLYSSTSTL